jgi:hypothetical protein
MVVRKHFCDSEAILISIYAVEYQVSLRRYGFTDAG